MKTRTAAAIVMFIIIAAASSAYIFHELRTWDLEYDTDGGTIPADTPSSYRRNSPVDLPEPVRPGYVFLGWHLDSGEAISSTRGMTGDLVLHASWIEEVRYSISYITDGGTLAEDSPAEYTSGHPITIPRAHRDGFSFGGWHTDPDLMDPIVQTDITTSGDLVLYACWVEKDTSGRGCIWEVSGTYYNGSIPHTVSGTVTQEDIILRNGSMYSITSYNLHYVYPGGSFDNTTSRGSWSGVNPVSLTYSGLDTVDGYRCTVWTDAYGAMYWLYRMDLHVRIVESNGVTYALKNVYSFEPDTAFTPRIESDHPLKVSGGGPGTIGDSITLTADGEDFLGWYVDGKLLSSDRSVTIDRVDPDMTIRARTSEPYIVLPDGTADLSEYGFSGSDVVDSDGGPASSDISALEPGLYTATKDESGIVCKLRFFIEDRRAFSHTWEYGGRTYSISLELLYSDVFRYGYTHPYGYRVSMTDQDYVSTYHTVSDRYIQSLVGQLREMSGDMDPLGYASLALSMVQTIPYKSDLSVYGTDEYWAYPLEYLWNGGGDCEDSSIFYNTLMMASGFDVMLLLFPDHAMSAVSVDGASGIHVTEDGEDFHLCETTSAGFGIGESADSRRFSPDTVYYMCVVRPQTGPQELRPSA